MAIGALSTIGQSDFIVSQMDKIQKQYQQVQAQLASGQTTDNFGDLGAQASVDITLRNQLDTVNDYKKVVVQLQTRTATMDQAMTSINTLAQSVQNVALASPQPDPTRSNVQTAARDALQQIVQELGVSVDGRFLFSGTSTNVNPVISSGTLQTNTQSFMNAALAVGQSMGQSLAIPTLPAIQLIVSQYVPPADVGSVSAAISSALNQDQDPANAGQLLAGTNATSDAVKGAMSAYFTNQTSTDYYQGSNAFPPTSIDVGITLNYSITAQDPAFQSILQGLTSLANLPLPTSGNISSTDYDKTAAAAAHTIAQGVAQLQSLIQQNGDRQQVLNQEATTQDQTLTFLQKQVDGIEAANLPDLSARLSVLQTQMQASYKVMAGLAQLSLVDYLK